MKIKNVKLKWYVLNSDFNNDKIIKYNIFYEGFTEEVSKRIKRDKIKNREEFKKYIDLWAHSNYWCRTEHEILVSSLFSKKEPEKIDVYSQIEMNIDLIIDYIIREMKIDFKDIDKKED